MLVTLFAQMQQQANEIFKKVLSQDVRSKELKVRASSVLMECSHIGAV